MASLTSELTKLTPVYSHYITETKINVPMVRKSLLQGKIRDLLSPKTVSLHKAMALFTSMQSEWSGTLELSAPSPEAEGEKADANSELSCAQLAFTEAKKAICVVAACAVVYDGDAKTRVAEAEHLTSVTRPELVKPLWDALLLIAKNKVQKKVEANEESHESKAPLAK